MIKRIISGAVLIGLIIGMFFIRQLNVTYFSLFIGIMAIAGTLEFMLASKKLSIAQSILTGLLPVFIFEGYIFADSLGVSFARLFAYVGAGYVFLQLAVLVLDYKRSKLDGFAFSLVCAVYPTVLLLPMMYINDFEYNSLVALIMCFVVPPCADMFEDGAKVEVIKKKTMYAQNASKLYELYKKYPSFESIPDAERIKVEKRILKNQRRRPQSNF